MDALDTAVVYGILGGAVAGFVNWGARDAPHVNTYETARYYLLFCSMGCLSAALASVVFGQTATVGAIGGFAGSFLMLGNYF